MPKPKTFDTDKVIIDVMHLFRQKGYESTSIKDLEKVTGLKAGSIYHTFSSKSNIFEKSLDHYLSNVVKKRINLYLKNENPIEGIRLLFTTTFDNNLGKNKSCLLTNSAIEINGLNDECKKKVTHGLQLLENAFEEAIDKAKGIKQIPKEKDSHSLAMYLSLCYQGILVMNKVPKPKKVFHEYTESVLQTLQQ